MKKITKRLLLLVGAISFSAALPLSSFASTMKSSPENTSANFTSARCLTRNIKFDRVLQNYDQNNARLNAKLQRIINAYNSLNCAPSGDVVDTLVAAGQFKTLTAAVGAAGLVDTLKTTNNITLFAPTDQAFAKLPAGTVEALLNDLPTLTTILQYHVIANTVPASVATTLSSATMLNGQTVTLSVQNGSLFINDSKVLLYDIKTTNGIIHVIDTVLLPSA